MNKNKKKSVRPCTCADAAVGVYVACRDLVDINPRMVEKMIINLRRGIGDILGLDLSLLNKNEVVVARKVGAGYIDLYAHSVVADSLVDNEGVAPIAEAARKLFFKFLLTLTQAQNPHRYLMNGFPMPSRKEIMTELDEHFITPAVINIIHNIMQKYLDLYLLSVLSIDPDSEEAKSIVNGAEVIHQQNFLRH